MSEELLKRLDVLGVKLGVAGEHLWEVLCRQGVLQGWFGLCYILAGVGSVVACYKLLRLARKKNKAKWSESQTDVVFGLGFAGVMVGIFGIIFICVGLTNIQYLFNPEMYALSYVQGLLK